MVSGGAAEPIPMRQNSFRKLGKGKTKMTIDQLLEMPYWIVDILPKQVPEDSPGQYFAIEEYYLSEPRFSAVKQKHIDLILKLNCYRDLALDEDGPVNPPPEQLAEKLSESYVSIMVGGSLIVSEPDSTYLTVYNPDDGLLELIRALSAGEGLYVWKP